MQYITERRHFHPDIQLPGISPYIRLKLYLPTLSGRSQTFLQRTTAHPIWSDWNLHLTSLSLPCCYFGHLLCSRAVYICYRLLKLSLQSSKNHKICILCHDIHSSGCKCSWVSLFTMHDQCKELTAHTGSIRPWDERQVSTDPTYQNNQLKQKTNCFFRVFVFFYDSAEIAEAAKITQEIVTSGFIFIYPVIDDPATPTEKKLLLWYHHRWVYTPSARICFPSLNSLPHEACFA